jgi:hypothetical protein
MVHFARLLKLEKGMGTRGKWMPRLGSWELHELHSDALTWFQGVESKASQ